MLHNDALLDALEYAYDNEDWLELYIRVFIRDLRTCDPDGF